MIIIIIFYILLIHYKLVNENTTTKKKRKMVTCPETGEQHQTVTYFDVADRYGEHWKVVKLPGGHPTIFERTDFNINYERISTAQSCIEFRNKILPHLATTVDNYWYKLHTSASRIFQCRKCFNCMSMIRYTVSYHETKEKALAHFQDKYSSGYCTSRSMTNRVVEPSEPLSLERNNQLGKFVMIIVQSVGEHKTWHGRETY